MRKVLGIVIVFFAFASPGLSMAQEVEPGPKEPRESLRSMAWYYGYPHGMLFHTAMFHGITTRYLLLSTALKSDELAKYLEIDDSQRRHIETLKPMPFKRPTERKNVDLNAQPDEQRIDPAYFDFLREDQLVRLDVLAFRFDGYAALSRVSLAKHLELSETTQKKITIAIKGVRDEYILPNSRRRFGGPQRPDANYRDCHFFGAIGTQLNLSVIDLLTDDECRRMKEFLDRKFDQDVVSAVEDLAKLPGGVLALADSIGLQLD